MRERLDRYDARLFRGERAVVGILFAAMAVVVFADVVHRIFSRAPGRLSVIVGGMIGVEPARLDETLSPIVILAICYGLAYGVVRTRAVAPGRERPSRRRALVLAAIATAVATGLVQAFVHGRPDGIVFAPYLGLCLMLWVGMIGASMATYGGRHLALEMSDQLWPELWRPAVKRVALALAALFSALIAILSSMSVVEHFNAWHAAPNADLIPSVDLPKWLVFVVLPYAFTAMGLRFALRALGLLSPPAPESIG